MAWFDGLTEKQRKFCELFSSNGGNAYAAATGAGYKKPQPEGARALENARIKSALEFLRQEQTSKAIATREERQSFWTSIMRDVGEKTTDRLKASELLGRCQADFIDRVDHSNSDGTLVNPTAVLEALKRKHADQ